MNPYLRFDHIDLWHIAGWTMVHFLWLGALVGCIAAALRLLLRRAAPNVRYVAAAASLALLAALPLTIAGGLGADPSTFQGGIRGGFPGTSEKSRYGPELRDVTHRTDSVADLELRGSELPQDLLVSQTNVEVIDNAAEPSLGPVLKGRGIVPSVIESCVAYLPWVWLVGTPLTLAFLATGIVGTERLRRASHQVATGPLLEMSARLVKSLRVGRRVVIAICDRVCAPVLVGIFRSMILLPPSALTNWTPDQIEMVLLHELAHVRRWDNLVNLLQRLVESLLFFHPAVWLVSGWMRRDREACCDAVVVRHTNNRRAYAELLVSLAAQHSELGHPRPRLISLRHCPGRGHPGSLASAMAAGPLRNRIRYILQLEDDAMLVTGKSFVLVLAGLLTAATLAVLYLPTRGQAEESATESTENTEDNGENRENEKSAESTSANATDREGEAKSESVNSAADLAPSRRVEVEQVPIGDENITVIRGVKDDVNAFVEHGVNWEPQHEWRVLGTFSPSPEGYQELFRAADKARSQNLHVEIDNDEENVKLVVVPAISEADWPAMLGDPPRKDRVIADKAWERLGLKVVPASDLEQLDFHSRRKAGPIKILGGNVPKGLPLPAFLRRIGGNDLDSFDDLHIWLINQEDQRLEPEKVYAYANGHEYLFDAGPAEEEAAPPQSSNPKFPSLEDQKLADLAWQMLQLELEPAGNEELKQVRALGYQGGVVVTGTARPDSRRLSYNEINPGDVLVGLHVWPTTSLKDVAAILTRDDLSDLNPLKFYVWRGEELVVTGRITVRSPSTQPSGLSQLDAADRGSKNSTASAGDLSSYVPPSSNKPPAASENEMKVLQEHIKTLQSQFDRIDALFKAGRRGGHASTRALAAYELAVAKGELALMQGQRAEAVKSFHKALSHAQDAYKAMSADYEAGNTTYDVMLLTSKNLAEIRRKIIQLEQERTAPNRATAAGAGPATSFGAPEAGGPANPLATSGATEPNPSLASNKRRDAGVTISAESQEALDEFMRLASSPQPGESISVLTKIVDREKQKYDYVAELAKNGKVTSAEAETQKANYEISIERLRQAERALRYHQALVELHAAEYESALESNKLAPKSISESELRKLQLKVQLAKAKYQELAE